MIRKALLPIAKILKMHKNFRCIKKACFCHLNRKFGYLRKTFWGRVLIFDGKGFDFWDKYFPIFKFETRGLYLSQNVKCFPRPIKTLPPNNFTKLMKIFVSTHETKIVLRDCKLARKLFS